MKGPIIVIFLLFFVAAEAQDSLNKTNIGIDFSMGNNTIGKGNIYPAITLSNNKHFVFAGPAFIYGMDYNPYAPAYGFFGGYQFFPNGQKNRFNLFFEYDMSLVKKQFKSSFYGLYPRSLSKTSLVVTSFDNYLGFGFQVNLSREFYFHTNVGLGIIFYKEELSNEYNSGSISNSNYGGAFIWKFFPYNSAGYDDVSYYPNQGRLVGIFKAGLGMNIHSFKKSKKK